MYREVSLVFEVLQFLDFMSMTNLFITLEKNQ